MSTNSVCVSANNVMPLDVRLAKTPVACLMTQRPLLAGPCSVGEVLHGGRAGHWRGAHGAAHPWRRRDQWPASAWTPTSTSPPALSSSSLRLSSLLLHHAFILDMRDACQVLGSCHLRCADCCFKLDFGQTCACYRVPTFVSNRASYVDRATTVGNELTPSMICRPLSAGSTRCALVMGPALHLLGATALERLFVQAGFPGLCSAAEVGALSGRHQGASRLDAVHPPHCMGS